MKPGTGPWGHLCTRGGATLSISVKRGRPIFGHSDSEVLRAGQGREETNIHMEGRYIYR